MTLLTTSETQTNELAANFGTSQPLVTIVVVPRERFSCTQASLEGIYQFTQRIVLKKFCNRNAKKEG